MIKKIICFLSFSILFHAAHAESFKERTLISNRLHYEMNQTPMREDFIREVTSVLSEEDSQEFKQVASRWKEIRKDIDFESSFSQFLIKSKNEPVMTLQVSQLEPFTIIVNYKNKLEIDPKNIKRSIANFIDKKKMSAGLFNILPKAYAQSIHDSAFDWLKIHSVMLVYSAGELTSRNLGDNSIYNVLDKTPNAFSKNFPKVSKLFTPTPKIICEKNKLQGSVEIDGQTLDFELRDSEIDFVNTDKKKYRIRLDEIPVEIAQIRQAFKTNKLNPYQLLTNKEQVEYYNAESKVGFGQKISGAEGVAWIDKMNEATRLSSAISDLKKDPRTGEYIKYMDFKRYITREFRSFSCNEKKLSREIRHDNNGTDDYRDSSYLRYSRELSYYCKFEKELDSLTIKERQDLEHRAAEIKLLSQKVQAIKYEALEDYAIQQIAKRGNIKASALNYQSCTPQPCRDDSSAVDGLFKLKSPTKTVPRSTASPEVSWQEASIEQYQNAFKVKHSLPRVLNLKGGALEPIPQGHHIDPQLLLEYKTQLLQMYDDLSKYKQRTQPKHVEVSFDMQLKDYQYKVRELESATHKAIINLKALNLCCFDNDCRAEVFNRAGVKLLPQSTQEVK